MSPKTIIINIAHGTIVDEAAITSALKQGMIAGYGTDVTNIQPEKW
jgi:lactate dehydrogenase-like 2-hydroxyacid dehydrogenase